jgi:hypothetical protein
MGAPLEYDFKVVGRAAVEREIASLERRFAQSAQKLAREFDKLGRGGAGSGSRAGSSSGSSFRDPMFGPGRKEQLAQIKANERAAVKAAREERRAIEQLNRSRQSLHNQRVREEKKAATELASAQRQQHREAESHQKYQTRLIREREKHLERERSRIQTVASGRVEFLRSTVGAGVGRVAGAVGSVARGAAGIAGLGAGAIAASSITEASRLDEAARRLAINARGSGEKGVDPETLRKEFSQVGIAKGISPEAIAAGVSSYVDKTGDLSTARKNAGVLATVSQGANADPTDIFNAAADLSEKLDVKSVEDMSNAFAILSAQGKRGAFTLKQMATEFPSVLSSAANAGVRGISGVRDIGAVMQLAMKATGNSAEAGTSVNSMFRQLAAKSEDMQSGKSFGGRKVTVWEGGDKTKPMRNFAAVALDAISAARGAIAPLNEVFDARGVKAINPMIAKYREVYNSTQGNEATKDKAAKAAAEGVFSNFRDAPAKWSDVESDANDAMKSFSVQMEQINSKLKDAVASELFPAIVKLVPQISALVPQVAKLITGFVNLVSWFADNPLKGIGLALVGSIGLELAKARLGSVLASGIQAILAGAQAGGLRGAAGAVVPSGKTTLGGALGAAGTGLAIGAAVAGTIYTGGIAKYEAGENSMAVAGKSLNDVRNANTSDIDAVKQIIAEQQKRVMEAKKTDILDDTLNLFGASNKGVEASTQEAFLQEMKDKLGSLEMKAAAEQQKAAAEALKEAASEMKGAKPNTSDKPTGIK